ncbi:MAG: TRAP transporter small permease [Desulfobacteraceae bacterium]|nr:TRAP transporter small permease [Desulfobacteraceae bacterium]
MKKLIYVIGKTEELFIGYALLIIAIFTTIEVVLRYVFHFGFDWGEELARYTTILITFMGAAVCVKYGTHFSMEALVEYVPNRIKHLLKVFAHLVSAFIMTVVFYYSWVQIGRLHQFGATSPAMQIPMYIPYLPIGIFACVITIRFFIQVVKHTNGLLRNLPFSGEKEGGHV